ncbi:unnamed protein product [Nyctereutes procyonoides]|uniref:non-specific serine/threonine protein kinase n=1 Tax=Nyctereutes procyonoides TaxID=34880 RepID=A0A811Z092_NYCPR|nr:unnamed protein product [Nyctereutes procyonoides]
MALLSSFTCSEFSSLRLHHNRTIIKESSFEEQTSHYLNELQHLATLGKRGYKRVHKIGKIMWYFAIKKILIKDVLTGLQHPNILPSLEVSSNQENERDQYDFTLEKEKSLGECGIENQTNRLMNCYHQFSHKRCQSVGANLHVINVMASVAIKIFQKLEEGVFYIYKMGIQVKIGDFGLACVDITQNRLDQYDKCDANSDMYSLGVIILELFQLFGTEIEQVQVLTSLRTGQIFESLSKRSLRSQVYLALNKKECNSETDNEELQKQLSLLSYDTRVKDDMEDGNVLV